MIFITGGAASGKREFAIRNLGFSANDFSEDCTSAKRCIYNLEKMDCSDLATALGNLQNKEVVICSELGCGVVPMDKDQRAHREQVGRLCIEIAKQADEVYRVYAGIGTKIK